MLEVYDYPVISLFAFVKFMVLVSSEAIAIAHARPRAPPSSSFVVSSMFRAHAPVPVPEG
jgi:hypothetical protein